MFYRGWAFISHCRSPDRAVSSSLAARPTKRHHWSYPGNTQMPPCQVTASFSAPLFATAFLSRGHRFHDLVEVEAARLLPRRELAEGLKPLAYVGPRGREQEHALRGPARVIHGRRLGAFKGIHAQIGDHRRAQFLERGFPDLKSLGVLPEEGYLPVVVTQCRHAAVVGPVQELLPRPFALALERGQQVVAVEVDLEGRAARAQGR